jgi:hypothetical protein
MNFKTILLFVLFSILLVQAKRNETIIECIVETEKEIKCGEALYSKEEKDKPGTFMFFMDMSVSLFCIVFDGLMSGLTLGLLSLDMLNLEIIKNSGKKKE